MIKEERASAAGQRRHSLDKRPPRFAETEKVLRSKLKGHYEDFVRRSDALLADAFR